MSVLAFGHHYFAKEVKFSPVSVWLVYLFVYLLVVFPKKYKTNFRQT